MPIKTHVRVMSGSIPLAPLVDVIFLLLVFFIMSSSLVFWPGTKVETEVHLPHSYTSSMSAADKLVITVPRLGRPFFNDRPVSWEDLELELRELVRQSKLATAKRSAQDPAANPAQRAPLVVLRADKSIPYEKVVEVMSLARSLGLGVYLVTDAQQESRPARVRLLGDGRE